ncbi:cutinase family protein [Dietzia sp.]|uniref:cutinase family protein n=1 Tax=Dietzia sp. TaxID=1871616 RepID=UPI002FD9269A
MAQKPRGRGFGFVLGVLIAVVLLVLGIGWFLSRQGGSGTGPEPGPGTGTAAPDDGAGRVQPADCPDVSLLSVPGTWESAANDEPVNPSANPNSLLLKVTGPLAEANDSARLETYTVPYTAQFRNPQRPQDVTYDASREEGKDKLRAKLAATHEHCPYTSFVLLGFSQGAVIAGDLDNEIGTGNGPVPADSVAGVVLIADGRRDLGTPGPGNVPGDGQGMEITLQPASGLTQIIAGATMTGARPGGFGDLADKTQSLCAQPDLICNAPLTVNDGAARFTEFLNNNAIHAQYDTNPDVIPGSTATEWTREHIQGLVDGAEHIAHS